MEEIKFCEHCGAKLTGRWESLSAGLGNVLIMFAKEVKNIGKNCIHLQKDLKLTKNQYNNFQKLQYFGMVAKIKDETKIKSGYWFLTKKAIDFLQGEKISKKVYVNRKKVTMIGEKLTTITEVLGSIPYWLQTEDFTQKLKSEQQKLIWT